MLRDLQIAWRNLGRHKRRTALAVLAIGVGQAAVLAMSGLMNGYADNIRRAITGPMIGHAQVHHPDWREERAMDLAMRDLDAKLHAIQSDPAVAGAAGRVYAPVLAAPKRQAYAAIVVGVDLEAESAAYGLLSGMKQRPGPGEVLIGYRLAREMKAEIGDEIAVVGQAADGSLANDLYTVKAIIHSPADLVNQSGVVMSLAEAQQLMVLPNQAHEIVIRTKKANQAPAMVKRLQQKGPLKDSEILTWQEIVPELTAILEMSDYMGYFVLIFVFIAAIAGIANTLMMSTFERMHEFGMLLGLGARPLRLVRMIVMEALILGILGVAAGCLIGYAFNGYFGQVGLDFAAWTSGQEARDMAYAGLNLPLKIHPRLEIMDTVVGLTAVMLTSLLAAVWPAWIAVRLEPMEAMRR